MDDRFRTGLSLYRKLVYAFQKAIVSGQLLPADRFPSIRKPSQELRINPNTAQKVVARLVDQGLLEVTPGVGTVVACLPKASTHECSALLTIKRRYWRPGRVEPISLFSILLLMLPGKRLLLPG